MIPEPSSLALFWAAVIAFAIIDGKIVPDDWWTITTGLPSRSWFM